MPSTSAVSRPCPDFSLLLTAVYRFAGSAVVDRGVCARHHLLAWQDALWNALHGTRNAERRQGEKDAIIIVFTLIDILVAGEVPRRTY